MKRFHLTFSQKKRMDRFLSDIGLRDGIPPDRLLNDEKIQKIIRESRDPVQKGQRVFDRVRNLRYPLSGGREEDFNLYESGGHALSSGVSRLDSRKKLVNPYYYGKGVFDLKEHVVSLIRSCPLDCAYCFLREVYDNPRFKVAPNYAQIGGEVALLRKEASGPLYLNAGENADSMILDAEFGLAKNLWDVVRGFPETFLEFRTKTDKVQNLLKIADHEGRIVMAASLNPPGDRELLESNTALIPQRIAALKEVQKAGFRIGLRFEPIVYTPDFKRKYEGLFEQVFEALDPAHIHSISLGCLRLTKGLSKMLQESHPRLMAEEWVLGSDKKWRYYRGIRVQVYSALLQLLGRYFPYKERALLSTEPAAIWQECGLPLKTMPEICLLEQVS